MRHTSSHIMHWITLGYLHNLLSTQAGKQDFRWSCLFAQGWKRKLMRSAGGVLSSTGSHGEQLVGGALCRVILVFAYVMVCQRIQEPETIPNHPKTYRFPK